MIALLLAMGLLAMGCAGEGSGTGAHYFGDYAGPEGRHMEFAPPEDPDSEPLMLRIEAERWEFRQGERWADAAILGDFELGLNDGLWVGGTQLLPQAVTVGESTADATVVETGEFETWYGRFPDTATVDADGGVWVGSQVFARDVGPIFLTLSGAEWELVYYE